jgi:hypothetical protein
MKTFYLFVVLLITTTTVFATPKLLVTVALQSNYQLSIDGLSVGNNYRTTNGFEVNDVQPQRYRLQITRQKTNLFGVVSYLSVYDGYVDFKNNTQTTLAIDVFDYTTITEQRINNGGTWGNNNGGGTWGNGRKKKHKRNHCNYTQTITNDAFNTLLHQLKQESFDSNKIDIVKTATNNNAVTAEQAKAIVMLLCFESNKLTIAKLLYNSTADKQNFFVVNDAFTFSTTKRELTEYIQTQI